MMPMGPKAVRNRVYADFLMPSRLGVYEQLLEEIIAAGYMPSSIERFWQLIVDGVVEPAGRYLLLRHDIDTDPKTGAAMWEIDRRLAVRSSYFFRLSTLDVGLMQEIGHTGGEAGYHFEELATVAKRRRVRNPAEVAALIPEAQDLFRHNLERIRSRSGLPIRVVASHGDFVNRRLGIQNLAILADPAFRLEAGVDLETNDDAFMVHVSSRHSDTERPRDWIPDDPLSRIRRGDPLEAVRKGNPVVYIVVHPRQWRVNRVFNARDDIMRLVEGLAYRLPPRRSLRTR
jgi:hypothetical protein